MKYKIERLYKDHQHRDFIKGGLTLHEAQNHCKKSETTSSKCKEPENIARTEKYGAWFDSYSEE